MSEDDVLAAVAAIAARELHFEGALTRDTPLVETLALDSLRQLTLLIEIEDRFRISFDEREETGILTVGDLVDTIRRKRAEQGANAR